MLAIIFVFQIFEFPLRARVPCYETIKQKKRRRKHNLQNYMCHFKRQNVSSIKLSKNFVLAVQLSKNLFKLNRYTAHQVTAMI